MSRINNLYDLHKQREAWIAQDETRAIFIYEGFRPSFLKQKLTSNVSYPLQWLPGEMSLEYVDPDTLRIELRADSKSKDALWQAVLVFAYLVGDGIIAHFYADDLPYYAVPKPLNLGGGPCAFFARSDLARDPHKAFAAGIMALRDKESLFRKLLVPMLHINSVEYYDIRFFGEYVLLEYLARNNDTSGTIIDVEDTDGPYSALQSILADAERQINDCADFTEEQKRNLIGNLDAGKINRKGTTRSKMIRFIGGLGKEFEEYIDDVANWGRLRNKGIAHGASFSRGGKLADENMRKMQSLHGLFCRLLYKDFRKRYDQQKDRQECPMPLPQR